MIQFKLNSIALRFLMLGDFLVKDYFNRDNDGNVLDRMHFINWSESGSSLYKESKLIKI